MTRLNLTYREHLKVTENDIGHILAQHKDIPSNQIGQVMMSPDSVYAKPWMPCVGEGGWLVEEVHGTMIVVDSE